eukprot:PhM_4_TR18737/c2_g1_i1/m.65843/K14312/NUP155, NUP170, NUP157; nuclear pore complex protein Nup155
MQHHEVLNRTYDYIKSHISREGSQFTASANYGADIPVETGPEALSAHHSSSSTAATTTTAVSAAAEVALPNFLHLKSVKWPAGMMLAREEMQSSCSMVLLESISRVCLTVDHRIMLWNYHTASDFKVIDDLDGFVVDVAVVEARPGVFQPYITHLLVATTRTTLKLFGLSFQSNGELNVHMGACSVISLALTARLPEATKKIAEDRHAKRVFIACNDGDLYEMVYDVNDVTQVATVKLVNLTQYFGQSNLVVKSLGTVMTSVLTTVKGRSHIADFTVDSMRHLIYILHTNGYIAVYTIGDGTQPCRLFGKAQHDVRSLRRFVHSDGIEVCPLVSLHAAGQQEMHSFVGVASNGDRYLYHPQDTDLRGQMKFVVREVVKFHLPVRRRQIQTILNRSVSLCFHSKAVTVLVRSAEEEGKSLQHTNDEVSFLTTSRIVKATESSEIQSGRSRPTVTFLNERSGLVDTKVNACAEVAPELLSAIAGDLPVPISSSDLVAQTLLPARRFVLVTRSGVSFVAKLRPVDVLHLILASGEGRSTNLMLENFVSEYGNDEYCCMLLLLCAGSGHSTSSSSSNLQSTGNRHPVVVASPYVQSPVGARHLHFSPSPAPAATGAAHTTPSRGLHTAASATSVENLVDILAHGPSIDVTRRAMDILRTMGNPKIEHNISGSGAMSYGHGGMGGAHGMGMGSNMAHSCQHSRMSVSELYRGCRLVTARLLAPIFRCPVFKRAAGKDGLAGTTFTAAHLDGFVSRLQSVLRVFDELRRDGWMDSAHMRTLEWDSIDPDEMVVRIPVNAQPFQPADATNVQAIQLTALHTVLTNAHQLLSLLRILTTCSMSSIFDKWKAEYDNMQGADVWSTQSLLSLTFEDLLCGPRNAPQRFARCLMRCVVKLSHTGRGALNTLCSQLERECPAIVGDVDVSEYRAQLAIEEMYQTTLRSGTLPTSMEVNKLLPSLLPIAKHLYFSNGLAGVVNRLADLGAYTAVASLCISAAHQLDPHLNALQAYLNRLNPAKHMAATPQAHDLLQSRWDCLNLLSAVLWDVTTQLTAEKTPDVKLEQRLANVEEVLGVRGNRKGSVWHMADCDELSQYYLFEMMLDHRTPDMLRDAYALTVVSLSSSYVERFLDMHRHRFGRELAMFHARNKRYPAAIKAYLEAVDVPVDNDRAMEYRVKILSEAMSCIAESGAIDAPMAASVERLYQLADIQRELLAIADAYYSSDAEDLNTVSPDDGRTYREIVAEHRARLTQSLLQDVDLHSMATYYVALGGAMIQLRLAYRCLPMTVAENQRFVCKLVEDALQNPGRDSVEDVVRTMIQRFFDTSNGTFFPLALVISALECAAYSKRPTGDDWTPRLLLATDRVPPQAILNAYQTIFETHFYGRRAVTDNPNATVSVRFATLVPRSFVLHSMCRLVQLWASRLGGGGGGSNSSNTTMSSTRNSIALAIAYCNSQVDACMSGDGGGGGSSDHLDGMADNNINNNNNNNNN